MNRLGGRTCRNTNSTKSQGATEEIKGTSVLATESDDDVMKIRGTIQPSEAGTAVVISQWPLSYRRRLSLPCTWYQPWNCLSSRPLAFFGIQNLHLQFGATASYHLLQWLIGLVVLAANELWRQSWNVSYAKQRGHQERCLYSRDGITWE